MKATGIVRRVDDLGRIGIPKEIRRTLRIREGAPLLKALTVRDRYLWEMRALHDRVDFYKGNSTSIFVVRQMCCFFHISSNPLHESENSNVLIYAMTVFKLLDIHLFLW